MATDLLAIELLARLQLTARRLGVELTLSNAPPELLELVEFVGLTEALRVEVERKPEEREERRRVEEERELLDPPV
jgi:hypothetical protein